MDKKQGNHIKKKQKYVLFLLLIFTAGLFLRVCNFSDYLRFNADQARDATVVRNMIENNVIPLLGPVAGGTSFRIGPISIYFQFLGARIFGAEPDKMAYMDLLFGIFSVLIIFFFFKEYFDDKIALSCAALYATSFFAIQYSRFAWNSNSSQFFAPLLLYAVIKIAHSDNKKKWLWAIVVGLAAGVLAQLHTLLLFGVPLFLFAIGVYFVRKKKIVFFHICIVVMAAIAVNTTQIINEIKTGQSNTVAFYNALNEKKTKQASLGENFLHVAACQIQANVRIIFPKKDQEKCGFPFTENNLKKINKENSSLALWTVGTFLFFGILFFSCFGYFSVIYRAFKAKEEKQKIFFSVIAVYCLSIFLVSVPFGAEISLRYFILTAFIPYLFVALLLEYFAKSFDYKFIFFIAIGIVIMFNVYFCSQFFKNYANGSGSMIDGSMKQTRGIAEYLIKQSSSFKSFQIGGKAVDLGRFADRISYFTNKEGISFIETDNQKNINEELPFFVAGDNISNKCEKGKKYKEYGIIEKCEQFGDVTILKMR